ncbi:MAG: LLM class flavin-dependent oxidoreductase, partial [Alphaproteobacteria bacterium]
MAEDRDAVIRADELDMVAIWCGEHVSSTTEPIASSLMFFASAIVQTKNIIFASGVINLPQQHRGHLAARMANCDHMCRGQNITGIGAGGLLSDFKL